MAIGTIDRDFTITALSSRHHRPAGREPSATSSGNGSSTSWHDETSRRCSPRVTGSPRTRSRLTIHLRNKDDHWVQLCCVLTSLAGTPIGASCSLPHPTLTCPRRVWPSSSTISGASPRSSRPAGCCNGSGPMRDMTALPQANSLTTRQWEILARIVRGERVPTIAADLHVSQSTVRNHLSAIFKRFGVHSQPELLRVIEAAPTHLPTDRPQPERLARRTECLAAFGAFGANLFACGERERRNRGDHR